MNLDTLKQQLKNGDFARVYVLYGEENYLKTFYCDKIIHRAVAKGMESFNIHRFDAENFDLPVFISALENLPLMSEYKCILLKDIDIDRMPAIQWKELGEALKDVPEQCIVIVHFDALIPDKRGSRLKALLTIAQKSGLAIELNHLSIGDLEKWVGKRIAQNGCRIQDDTLDFLIETCGNDMNHLTDEIEKFCAFASGGEITKQDIGTLAVRPLSSSVYDLAKAIIANRTNDAMKIVDELFYKKEEPVIILSALSGAFCDLYRARAATASGVGQAELLRDFNYRGKEFRIRNAIRDSRNSSPIFLNRCIELLYNADENIKSGRMDKRLIFERLITEMAVARTL